MKIEKEAIEVIVLTQFYRVEGTIHVLPGARLTDFITARTIENFIPVTDARVYSIADDRLLYETTFMNLNTNFVIIILPKKDISRHNNFTISGGIPPK